MEMITNYLYENRWTLVIVSTVGFVGNLALLILVLDTARPTVAGAIATAFRLLPVYFFASLLGGLIIFLGLAALIVPGMYLAARLTSVGPVLVEERRSAIDAIRRSFEISNGNGWAILGLLLIVILTFYVVRIVAVVVLGSAFLLLDKAGAGGIGAFLLLVLDAALSAAFATLLIVLIATIYRHLAARPDPSR
jgi:membrane-anchored glycerophosphoryl diester phosphodiesterase (GDPDase)